MTDRPTITSPWADLAGNALRAASREQYARASQHMQRIADRYGPDVIPRVLLSMIDTVLIRSGHTHGGQVQVVWMETETGTMQTADEVSPAVRWAGRFFAARVADDEAQAMALLRSVHTPEQWSANVAALLNVCGTQLRTMDQADAAAKASDNVQTGDLT